ncbi:MAG: hypothetical protein P8Y39_00730 [Nitrospirota bacterium]|jgi:hypothetical protein
MEKTRTGVCGWVAFASLLAAFSLSLCLLDVRDADAIPAFGRKYNLTCNACHTREPRLNPFGQRFQENGYQMPATEEGGRTLKELLGGPVGGATLGQVTNFTAVRLRAEVRKAGFRETEDDKQEDFDVVFPKIINLFFAGTAARNISFFIEGEFNAEEEGSGLGFERVFLVFDNLGGYQLANFKIGNFDPSAFYSFPTHRQQLDPIPPDAETDVFPPEIKRIPMLPFAFSSKMYGLTTGPAREGVEGFAILPFEPFLFDVPASKGATVYGRPFGPSFLYQVGVAQGDTAEDSQDTRWDIYGMLRYDIVGPFSDVQVSGFYYHAQDAARPTLNPSGSATGPFVYAEPVDWDRFGVAARWHYKYLDIYGTGIWDWIGDVRFAGAPGSLSKWDEDAFGLSVEADWLVNRQWLLGARYDFMDPGGLAELPPALQQGGPKVNQDASFLGVLAKFYPVPNIGLYARSHFNLAGSKKLPPGLGSAESPARNLQYIASVGVDMAF